jgi:DNA-binding MarR family transcriptional regulator
VIVSQHDSLGAWAKRCYLAGRLAMEDVLRPHDLGATQWYVLHQLAHVGPTLQRDLARLLQVERPTLSVIVSALVRKGLIEQLPDRTDQRQKLLQMTPAGTHIWNQLPDLTHIHHTAFSGLDAADIAIAIKVLRTATERLDTYSRKGVPQ